MASTKLTLVLRITEVHKVELPDKFDRGCKGTLHRLRVNAEDADGNVWTFNTPGVLDVYGGGYVPAPGGAGRGWLWMNQLLEPVVFPGQLIAVRGDHVRYQNGNAMSGMNGRRLRRVDNVSDEVFESVMHALPWLYRLLETGPERSVTELSNDLGRITLD